MKVNSLMITIICLVVIFSGIFLSDSLGIWKTESSKEPLKFTSGEFEGQPNPEDIRGSYSFGDIENAFGVKAALIAEAFGINVEEPEEVKAKDLEEIYGELGEDIEIGTGSVKKFVSLFTGLPYEGDDYLPRSAVKVLEDTGKWDDDMEASMVTYVIDVHITGELSGNDTIKENETEHVEEIAIKGKTTVADAIDYGISLEQIEEVLGIEISNKNILIRDLCEQNGLSFSSIKESLNEKLKQLKEK